LEQISAFLYGAHQKGAFTFILTKFLETISSHPQYNPTPRNSLISLTPPFLAIYPAFMEPASI
jgi:hypothetical protein